MDIAEQRKPAPEVLPNVVFHTELLSGIRAAQCFDPASGAYTASPVGGEPSDAHGNWAGSVWWVDYTRDRLCQLSTSANWATIWQIPGSNGLYSTSIDGGDVHVSDYCASYIYKLDPDTNQLCTYALPDFGVTEYLLVHGGTL